MKIYRIASRREGRKLRVAAYARVSTGAEEQAESYETQINYYTRLIRQNAAWEYAGVYADRAKTALSAERRPAFQRMIADAKARAFDLLLVKSISRFARNAADAQEYVHLLKACGVEARFEAEGISSFDPAAEMMFNLLAAVAQQESKNKSEYVRWTYRKLAERGVRHIGNNRVLGYDEVMGVLTPNDDAWIVKMIFERYAAGASVPQIAKALNEAGAKRLRSDRPFTASVIYPMLRNEIYVGDRLLQKSPPRDYLTKKPDAAIPYMSRYIARDHEAIIDAGTWRIVQARLLEAREAEDARRRGSVRF